MPILPYNQPYYIMNFRPNLKSKEQIASELPKYELISDFMVQLKDLITFRPEQSIYEAINVMIDRRISGAPVLDDEGKLVGIISEKDCLRLIVDQAYHNIPLDNPKVADYMTKSVKTLSADNDIVGAANAFLETPIRRLPIVKDGVLVGQVSRRDILKAAKNISPTAWA